MRLRKWILLLFMAVFSFQMAHAQIEADYMTFKNFQAIGFGGFLNFAFAVNEGSSVTVEGGVDYFRDKDDDETYLIPVLLGYRYTLDQSGTRWYIEPNAGYQFGETDATKDNGDDIKIQGPAAGVAIGYIFGGNGSLLFNVGLRYERGFGPVGTNMLTLRISHSFTFFRRRGYY